MESKYQNPPVLPVVESVAGAAAASGALLVFLLVQKLTASGVAKPLAPAAGLPLASARKRLEFVSTANLYCFKLPTQRGWPCPSGRNTPMYTWSEKAPELSALSGRLVDANTLLTAWMSLKMRVSAASSVAGSTAE